MVLNSLFCLDVMPTWGRSSSIRHRLQSQQAADPLPPLVQEFVPFIRTDEVTLDPLEADANLSPQTHTDTGQTKINIYICVF